LNVMRCFFYPLMPCVLFLLGGLTAFASGGSPTSRPFDETVPADAVAHLDITYVTRETGPEKLDVYTPAGGGPFPVVIWIHGGAWKMGGKAKWPHMNFLVGEGYAVANVEYRFSQVAPFPAQLEDCTAALDFLSVHAGEYHLDAKRIAVTGESAGGHLATLLGLKRSAAKDDVSKQAAGDDAEGRICAVIDLFGPTDLVALSNVSAEARQNVEQLLGGSAESRHDLAVAASPLWKISKGDPPFLIFHGTADPQVPFKQSRELAEGLAAAGVAVEFVPVDEAGHAGPVFWTAELRGRMIAFLSRKMPSP
jgi:acetyl esterase/lipase